MYTVVNEVSFDFACLSAVVPKAERFAVPLSAGAVSVRFSSNSFPTHLSPGLRTATTPTSC